MDFVIGVNRLFDFLSSGGIFINFSQNILIKEGTIESPGEASPGGIPWV
jgi:hypothetical protein